MFACNEKRTLLNPENLKDIICVHVSKLMALYNPLSVEQTIYL